MYFDGKNSLPGVEIHGIGVGPSVIPPEYLSQVGKNEIYYMANSHRFKIADQSRLQLVFEVKRPNDAPSLLFFKVN